MVAIACVASHPKVIIASCCLYSITCCLFSVLYAHALLRPMASAASVGLQPLCKIICTSSACASVTLLHCCLSVGECFSMSSIGTTPPLYFSCCCSLALVMFVSHNSSDGDYTHQRFGAVKTHFVTICKHAISTLRLPLSSEGSEETSLSLKSTKCSLLAVDTPLMPLFGHCQTKCLIVGTAGESSLDPFDQVCLRIVAQVRRCSHSVRTHTHDWPYVVPLSLQVSTRIVPSGKSKMRFKIRIYYNWYETSSYGKPIPIVIVGRSRDGLVRKIHFDMGVSLEYSTPTTFDYSLSCAVCR